MKLLPIELEERLLQAREEIKKYQDPEQVRTNGWTPLCHFLIAFAVIDDDGKSSIELGCNAGPRRDEVTPARCRPSTYTGAECPQEEVKPRLELRRGVLRAPLENHLVPVLTDVNVIKTSSSRPSGETERKDPKKTRSKPYGKSVMD